MTTDNFVKTLLPFAKEAERGYKVPAMVAMAQAALESGWGERAPGNMYFGVKAGKNWTGKKQLLKTTEYHDNPNVVYPVTINIVKITDNKYKYTVKDYFRAYDSPQGSFNDYAKFLTENKRYAKAFQYTDPVLFAKEIAAAGYATDSNYFDTLKVLINQIKKKVEQLQFLGELPS